MKLIDILLEKQEIGDTEFYKGFLATKTEEDPETGSQSWKIDYLPRNQVSKNLDQLIHYFKILVTQEEFKDDTKLPYYLEHLLHFRKTYKMYMSKNYGKV